MTSALPARPALSVAQDASGVFRLCAVDECPRPTPKIMAQPLRALDIPAPARVKSPEPRDTIVTVHFKLASSRLTPQARDAIDAARSDLLAAERVQIIGSTDAVGTKRFNRRLASARAESVRRYLLAIGVDGARIETRTACCIEDPPRINPPARRAEIRIRIQTR